MDSVLSSTFLIAMPTLTVELLNPRARTILDGLADTGLIAIDAPPKQWVMEKAAEHLYADYATDENLTAFTQLDCEDFYEAR